MNIEIVEDSFLIGVQDESVHILGSNMMYFDLYAELKRKGSNGDTPFGFCS